MILDASTFEQVGSRRPDHRRRRRAAPARPDQDRAVRLGVRDQHGRLRRRSSRSTRRCRRFAGPRRPRPPAKGSRSRRPATHPFAKPEGQPIVKEERYVGFVALRRDPRCGGKVSRACTCTSGWRPRRSAGGCLEAICPWLPVVLALSANSPWYSGELTGMASNRAPVLAELPRAGGPPGFASYARVGVVGRAARRARRDPGLHAHLVGRPAAPRARHARGAHSGPAHRRAASRRRSPRSCRRCARPRSTTVFRATQHSSPTAAAADYAQNRWAAARSGPGAELLHPAGDRVATRGEPGRRADRAGAPGGTRTRRRVRPRPARPGGLRGGSPAHLVRHSRRRRISSPGR